MKRPAYIAWHAFLFAAAVTLSWMGVAEIVDGGSLAQGLIRLAIAFVILATQLRGIYWDRRKPTDGISEDLGLT